MEPFAWVGYAKDEKTVSVICFERPTTLESKPTRWKTLYLKPTPSTSVKAVAAEVTEQFYERVLLDQMPRETVAELIAQAFASPVTADVEPASLGAAYKSVTELAADNPNLLEYLKQLENNKAEHRIEKELANLKATHVTEHDGDYSKEPEGRYWRGVRIGLEVALNILKESHHDGVGMDIEACAKEIHGFVQLSIANMKRIPQREIEAIIRKHQLIKAGDRGAEE